MALVDFQIEFPPQGVVVLRSQHLSSSSSGKGKFEILGREYFETAEEDHDGGRREELTPLVMCRFFLASPALGPFLKDVRTMDGERGVGPKADVVREFA